mmetsp:Transcript_129936/g.417036  ORF Transcript_129936/g.417036 Transcript_129936/m.417036 type:complete len:282 (+) Transcript_129936:180-1025(+)
MRSPRVLLHRKLLGCAPDGVGLQRVGAPEQQQSDHRGVVDADGHVQGVVGPHHPPLSRAGPRKAVEGQKGFDPFAFLKILRATAPSRQPRNRVHRLVGGPARMAPLTSRGGGCDCDRTRRLLRIAAVIRVRSDFTRAACLSRGLLQPSARDAIEHGHRRSQRSHGAAAEHALAILGHTLERVADTEETGGLGQLYLEGVFLRRRGVVAAALGRLPAFNRRGPSKGSGSTFTSLESPFLRLLHVFSIRLRYSVLGGLLPLGAGLLFIEAQHLRRQPPRLTPR